MKIRILESAKRDLKEGFYFYERQKKGLGHYFVETLMSDIESLRIFAGIHTIHFGKYYRLLSKRLHIQGGASHELARSLRTSGVTKPAFQN